MRGSILANVDVAVASGARRANAAKESGISVRTIERWRKGGEDRREGPASPSPNRLTAAERSRILAVAAAPEHRDLSPKQIVPLLANRGVYVMGYARIVLRGGGTSSPGRESGRSYRDAQRAKNFR